MNKNEAIRYHAIELFKLLENELDATIIKSFTIYEFEEYYDLDFCNIDDSSITIKIKKEEKEC